jgi:hypothetical protein
MLNGLNHSKWMALMHIIDIIWLPQVIDKLAWKHQVTPEEVDEVLFGNPFYRKESGRYLSVFFIYKQTREALILSARDMDRKEKRRYDRR